jgi:uncharacterized protein
MTTTTIERSTEKQEQEPVAIVVGMTNTNQVMYESAKPLGLGEYVTVLYGDNQKVLGFVEQTYIESHMLDKSNIRNFQEAYETTSLASQNTLDKSYHGYIRIIGYLDKLKTRSEVKIPSIPAEPGSEVHVASPMDLQDIFAPPNKKQCVPIGTSLRNDSVKMSINVSELVSNHGAVLAKTGYGKTNTVSKIVKEVAKKNGTVIIFDRHNEYSVLETETEIVFIEPVINPRRLEAEHFCTLIGISSNATRQRHMISAAFGKAKQHKGEDFWKALVDGIMKQSEGEKATYDVDEVSRVADIVKDMERYRGHILDANLVGDPVRFIFNRRINVMNLADFADPGQADLIIAHYLDNIFEDRKVARQQQLGQYKKKNNKKAWQREPHFIKPVLVVLEEAYLFIPKVGFKGEGNTWTRPVAAKIAREGRKMGVGLLVVSQRPRAIDDNILSQLGSVAVMQMTHKDDLKAIESVSESLSEELIKQLPSLNKGEAILAGRWVPTATFAKIDEVTELLVGTDIDAIEEWEDKDKDYDSSNVAATNVDTTEGAYIPDGYTQDA